MLIKINPYITSYEKLIQIVTTKKEAYKLLHLIDSTIDKMKCIHKDANKYIKKLSISITSHTKFFPNMSKYYDDIVELYHLKINTENDINTIKNMYFKTSYFIAYVVYNDKVENFKCITQTNLVNQINYLYDKYLKEKDIYQIDSYSYLLFDIGHILNIINIGFVNKTDRYNYLYHKNFMIQAKDDIDNIYHKINKIKDNKVLKHLYMILVKKHMQCIEFNNYLSKQNLVINYIDIDKDKYHFFTLR